MCTALMVTCRPNMPGRDMVRRVMALLDMVHPVMAHRVTAQVDLAGLECRLVLMECKDTRNKRRTRGPVSAVLCMDLGRVWTAHAATAAATAATCAGVGSLGMVATAATAAGCPMACWAIAWG